MPTWLHIPGCLALGEWSHHRDYLGHEDLFVQFFCVFLQPLLNIFCFCYVPTISVLYWTHLCMKCSLDFSNFLEEISSLSHSIVFLYFFALITEEGFLSFFAILWNSAFKWVYLSFSPLLFASFLFIVIFKPSSNSLFFFYFFAFLFLGYRLDSCLCTMSWTFIHSSSGTLSIRFSPLNLFLTSSV